jgi:hypothetical protein
MITINKKNGRINVMKFTFVFMLLPLLVLLASFKKENKVYNVTGINISHSDTLVSAMTAKFKTVKTLGAYLELVQDKNEKIRPVPVSFLPNDPDGATPSPIPVTGASGSARARTQLKAYMDSLIIDPKSSGLLRKQ